MSDTSDTFDTFKGTGWGEKDHSQSFVDSANVIVPERGVMHHLLLSFYRRFINAGARVLDLGCGDGIVSEKLLAADPTIKATLIDASSDMIERAKVRLNSLSPMDTGDTRDAGDNNVRFITESFEGLLSKKANKELKSAGGFNLIFSSLALHHLAPEHKQDMLDYVFSLLTPGGFFINMEVCAPPRGKDAKVGELEDWYVELWNEKMKESEKKLSVKVDRDEFIRRHGEPKHYAKLEDISEHLGVLTKSGFHDVDCYYKYGMFAMYGGRK